MEAILWLIGATIALSWGYGIRTRTASGVGVTNQTVNTTMLFFVSLFVSPALGSTWHLLWLFPLSVVIGTLSLAPPFALLTPFGQRFGTVCCIGLDQSEISAKGAAFHDGAELAMKIVAFAKNELISDSESPPGRVTRKFIESRPGWDIKSDGSLEYEGREIDGYLEADSPTVRTVAADTRLSDVGFTILMAEQESAPPSKPSERKLLVAALDGFADYIRTHVGTIG